MLSHVMLIEDDEDIRMDLGAILEDEGFTVTTASNGCEALDYLRQEYTPRLILLDLMMPVMNGWELRGELLKDQRLAGIPVVVISGAADVAREARALGAVGYLVKPIMEFAPLFTLLDTYR